MRIFRPAGALAVASAVIAVGLVAPTGAMADMQPQPGDVVGVGADVLSFAGDFLADGDTLGDGGYDTLGNLNRIASFDASPDGNARLAYGPAGVAGPCNTGTGTGAGSGQVGTTPGVAPCILNPTIVTRAGLNPVQRPNGTGNGFSALLADHGSVNTPAGYATYTPEINFVRASKAATAAQVATAVGQFGGLGLDSVQIGTDKLAMAADSSATNVVALSTAQLKSIYTCSSSARTWNQVGGTSTDAIVPLIAQLNSGTRSQFETDIGITDASLGSCVHTAEESDPFAIYENWSAGVVSGATASSASTALTIPTGVTVNVGDLVTGTGIATGTTVAAVSGTSVTLSAATTGAVAGVTVSTNPKDVMEPFSGGRLNLWNGVLGATSTASGAGGYFLDPTNAWAPQYAADVTAHQLVPDVSFVSGTPSDTNPIYNDNRNVYIYFRDVDVNSTSIFQPGGTLNWVRTLFYNPCSGTGHTTGCTTVGGSLYGPGGVPWVATGAGQALISASGIVPTYVTRTGA